MPATDGYQRAARLAATACLLSLLAACGTPAVPPRGVHVRVAASPALNPDRDGRSAPVMVHVYELAAADDFRQAGFFDLYEHDKQVLGTALLWRSVLAVRPGQQLTLDPPVLPQARYLAVLVAYRDIYRARWRSIAELPLHGASAWSLALQADRLTLRPLDRPSGTQDSPDKRKEKTRVLEQ